MSEGATVSWYFIGAFYQIVPRQLLSEWLNFGGSGRGSGLAVTFSGGGAGRGTSTAGLEDAAAPTVLGESAAGGEKKE